MGILASCCGRRKKDSAEREPLLSNRSQQDDLPPARNALDKSVDAYSALNTGKLPSQSQINQFISLCLRSGLLRYQQGSTGGPLSQSGQTLLVSTREVLEALSKFGAEKNDDDRVQEFLYLTSQFSQDGVPPVKVNVDALVDVTDSNVHKVKKTTTEISEDVETLAASLRTVLSHLLTSAAFRVLLSDILLAMREMTAQLASSVAVVAEQVEVAAHDVEDAAMVTTSVDGLKGKARDTMADVAEVGTKSKGIEEIQDDEINRVKTRITRRVQEVIYQAHQNPEDKTALLSILSLCRKYADSAAALASGSGQPFDEVDDLAPTIEASPTLSKEVEHAKVLLERLASNHSLDPVLSMLSATMKDILRTDKSSMEIRDYFHRLSSFFYMALTGSDYVSSSQFSLDCEILYDDGRRLLRSEEHAAWAQDFRRLVDESSSFMDSIRSDPSTSRLISAIQSLRNSISAFTIEATAGVGQSKRRMVNEVRKDLVGWILPKILRSIKRLPMPRVEMIMGKLECAVDALLLNTDTAQKISGYSGTEDDESITQGLLPQRMWMQSWNEIRVDMEGHGDSGAATHQVKAAGRVKVHIDGVKLSASGIGYYLKYKDILFPGLSYSDEGLLSVSSGEGVSIDVDLETREDSDQTNSLLPNFLVNPFNQTPDEDKAPPLFQVHDVQVQIPGLSFRIDESKHFILNKTLLQPLAGPVVRNVVAYVLSSQLKQGMEKVAWVGGEIERKAEEIKDRRTRNSGASVGEMEGSPSVDDWLKAFFHKVPLLFSSDQEPPLPDTTTETHTTATMKGIIYSSTTTHQRHDTDETENEETDLESPPTPEQEMVIAVGAGAQLFPGKGGPYGEESTEASLEGGKQVLSDLVEEIEEEGVEATHAGASLVQEGLRETGDGAARARAEIDRAGKRKEKVESREARSEGWRSSAFDL